MLDPKVPLTTENVIKTGMGLVALSDRKDTYFTLVCPEILDWIYQPYNPPGGNKTWYAYEEKVPKSIRDQYAKKHGKTTCRVTVGSWDNDRALLAPGERFQTLTLLMQYVESNNMRIVGEYHGLVY